MWCWLQYGSSPLIVSGAVCGCILLVYTMFGWVSASHIGSMTEVRVSCGAAGTLPSCYMESPTLQEFSSTITQLTGENLPNTCRQLNTTLFLAVDQSTRICFEPIRPSTPYNGSSHPPQHTLSSVVAVKHMKPP